MAGRGAGLAQERVHEALPSSEAAALARHIRPVLLGGSRILSLRRKSSRRSVAGSSSGSQWRALVFAPRFRSWTRHSAPSTRAEGGKLTNQNLGGDPLTVLVSG
jgi:hypothetical protein